MATAVGSELIAPDRSVSLYKGLRPFISRDEMNMTDAIQSSLLKKPGMITVLRWT